MKPLYRDIFLTPDSSFSINRFQQPFFDVPWHLHPQFEIIYVVNSSGTRYVGDSIEPFEKHDLVLLGNGLPHCWLNASLSECKGKNFETDYIVVQFNPDFLGKEFFKKPELKELYNFLKQSMRGIHFKGKTVHKVEKKLLNILETKGFDRIILFFQLLNDLLRCPDRRLLSSIGFLDKFDFNEHPALQKVKTYILENFKSGIRLDEAAKYAGMTTTSFCRFFKAQHKQPFFSYVKEFRIGYASRLLRESHLSIHEIAYESGYDNLSNFYRQFKEVNKVSPKVFKYI